MKNDESLEKMLYQYVPKALAPEPGDLWARIQAGKKENPRPRPALLLRPVLVVVLALTLLTATVFADEIKELLREMIHGNITVVEYPQLRSAFDGEPIDCTIYFEGAESLVPMTPEEQEGFAQSEYIRFASLEEVQAAVLFPFRVPRVPEGYTFLYANALRLPSGRYEESIDLYFGSKTQMDVSSGVSQRYVGPNCQLDVQITENPGEIEAIIVNGREAIYLSAQGMLLWVDENIAYIVHSATLEEALLFAEALAS